MIFIVMIMLAVCAAGLIIFAALYLSAGYKREHLEDENRRLRQLLKKSFLVERDYREACAAMFREANRRGDFQESRYAEENEDY